MGEQLIMLLTSVGVYCDHFVLNDATLEEVRQAVLRRWSAKLRHGHRVVVSQVVSVQQFVVTTKFHEIGSVKASRKRPVEQDGLKEMMKAWDDEEDGDPVEEDVVDMPTYVKKIKGD